MQRLIAGFLGFIFLLGCHSGPPKGIIAQEKMVSVLTDVHLADGYVSSVPMDSVQILRNSLYAGIYEKYDTDSAGLRHSLEYYSAQPQVYDSMYSNVKSKLQGLVDSEQAKETAKMKAIQRVDSIRNAHVRDSLNRIVRDSADFKLKRHLLYWLRADSASHLKPGVWTKETAAADFLTPIGLQWLPSVPAGKAEPVPAKPQISAPLERNRLEQMKPLRPIGMPTPSGLRKLERKVSK
ncbi:protein of unknown function [bacterium A37T11]|nr:protein of unknown function [bacterium A37T11]